MAESEHSQRKSHRSADDQEVSELTPADSARKAELDSEVDSLLDEIDDVLEVNAEEFVRSFVQKGGQ
ncbi:MAG TPA: ubiquitin-like protein Pup [Propionibacteriaceae bacterium]|nr:ubiquitin-like protein Pup [Propionibacteriaceae bacterium]